MLARRSAVSAVAVCFAVSAFASHDESHEPVVEASWETAADGGMISDDVARHAVASKSRNNSVESLFVAAVRAKSAALQAIGIHDLDAVTSAFDVATGEHRWTTAYDGGLGIHDDPSGIELNYNNNILHVVVGHGSDSTLVTYSVSNGSELGTTPLPGAEVHGTTITVAGSEMAVAGQVAGRFYFADYESGPEAITIDSQPVVGEAFDVAIHNKTWINSQGVSDWAPGDTTSWRTFVATGREGNFTGANVYTAAYRTDQTGHDPIWARTWDGPDQNWDEGLAAETGYVRSRGLGLAWTAARSRDASGNWDIVVSAHDLATGEPFWSDGVRTWGGEGGSEDAPVAMWYADATETLYVTGTTARGFPHGVDIVTLAFDALTGAQRAVAFASGDISNGDDEPTGITATHDGQRVFVAAEIHDLREAGGGAYRAGLFAYYAGLYPAGSALLSEGGAGVDQASGVAVDIDQSRVLLGGSTDPISAQREDLAGAAFPRASFLPEPATGIALPIGFALLLAARRARRAGGQRGEAERSTD
jgi:hypothetical protein